MPTQDILFKKKKGIFSYRVAGVLIREGRVLLQHVEGQPDFAFPGGHARLGEVSAETLVREIKEEINADVQPVRLLWVGETFFRWGDRNCHQIGLYYLIALADETQIPLRGCFRAGDLAGAEPSRLEFCWFELDRLGEIEVYPVHAREKLRRLADHIEHFVDIQVGK